MLPFAAERKSPQIVCETGEAVLWGQNTCWFGLISSLSTGKPESTQASAEALRVRWGRKGGETVPEAGSSEPPSEATRRISCHLGRSRLGASELQNLPPLPGPGEPWRARNVVTLKEPSLALKPVDVCPIVGWMEKWLPWWNDSRERRREDKTGRRLCHPTLILQSLDALLGFLSLPSLWFCFSGIKSDVLLEQEEMFVPFRESDILQCQMTGAGKWIISW